MRIATSDAAIAPATGAPSYRWVILAVGCVASAAYSSTRMGLPALSPHLSERFGLTLAGVGLVLGSLALGQLLLTYSWGRLADRAGERLVLTVGLTGGGLALGLAAIADEVGVLVGALLVGGMFGGSAMTASGRAVMGWFPRSERGLALGVRQMALPLGGAAAAVWLPWMAGVLSVSAALAGLGAIMLAGALVSLLGMREPATEPQRRSVDSVVPWRDASLWRLSGAAACLHAAQAALIAFLVLYLHDGRGLSVGSAAACLAIVQLAGALLRPLVGRWSDRAGRRIPLMRAIALAAAVLLAISALLGDGVTTVATLTLLLPAGVLALSWNGLGQTAAVELAGAERAGAALGLQNTAVSLASGAMPPLFGLLVQQAGWHAAFAVIAGLQMLAVLRLGPLVREEARRVSGPH